MSAALNFTPQAIEAFRSYPFPQAPIDRASYHWVANLLERAEVFQLPDCGELLNRSKPKPEVPGLMFRPSFDVVACEYQAQRPCGDSFYNAVPCSKRIALAWDWKGELPAPLSLVPEFRELQDGVAVLSLSYVDTTRSWIANTGAMFVPYNGAYIERATYSPFEEALIANGQFNRRAMGSRGYETTAVPLMLDTMSAAVLKYGSRELVYDAMRADANDELNAYIDLCYALACKNVDARRITAPKILNQERRRKKRPLLKDYHVLDLGGDSGAAGSAAGGDRNGPRSHLRRGHIRRLPSDRVTWVNQTMVHGHGGFVDKIYRMKGAA